MMLGSEGSSAIRRTPRTEHGDPNAFASATSSQAVPDAVPLCMKGQGTAVGGLVEAPLRREGFAKWPPFTRYAENAAGGSARWGGISRCTAMVPSLVR